MMPSSVLSSPDAIVWFLSQLCGAVLILRCPTYAKFHAGTSSGVQTSICVTFARPFTVTLQHASMVVVATQVLRPPPKTTDSWAYVMGMLLKYVVQFMTPGIALEPERPPPPLLLVPLDAMRFAAAYVAGIHKTTVLLTYIAERPAFILSAPTRERMWIDFHATHCTLAVIDGRMPKRRVYAHGATLVGLPYKWTHGHAMILKELCSDISQWALR